MGHKINWLIENEIVYAQFWGTGNEAELRDALITITTMREESPRDAVHVISNTTGVTSALPFQDSMKVIQEFKDYRGNGWEIVIGKLDKIMSFSLSISRSILKTKSINLKTMDEAIEYLKKEDDTLNWDHANMSVFKDDILSQ